MINNKTLAIILAVLTFILGSFLLVNIIFYFFGYPLSSLAEHQNYLFFAILVGAALASLVYGRGSGQRAADVTKLVNESLKLEIKEKDTWKMLRIVEQMPPYVIDRYVSMNINAVEEYRSKIEDYTNKLTEEDLLKINKIIETPIPHLQDLLEKLYLKTKLTQFKKLGAPQAENLLKINLEELKRILSKN